MSTDVNRLAVITWLAENTNGLGRTALMKYCYSSTGMARACEEAFPERAIVAAVTGENAFCATLWPRRRREVIG